MKYCDFNLLGRRNIPCFQQHILFHKMAICNALTSLQKCQIQAIFHSEFIPNQNLYPSHPSFHYKYSNNLTVLEYSTFLSSLVTVIYVLCHMKL